MHGADKPASMALTPIPHPPPPCSQKLRAVPRKFVAFGYYVTMLCPPTLAAYVRSKHRYMMSSAAGFRGDRPTRPKGEIGFLKGRMGICGNPEKPTQVDYGSEGRGFESCRARKRIPPQIAGFRFWHHRFRVALTSYPCEKRLEKVVVRGEIPKHYLTERGILSSRKELDGWPMGP